VFDDPGKSWHPDLDLDALWGKSRPKRQKQAANDLSNAFLLFQNLGFEIDERLKNWYWRGILVLLEGGMRT
jgi:hypothetical protein